MSKEYKQLTLKERKEIEEGLNHGDSFRAIARLIKRNPTKTDTYELSALARRRVAIAIGVSVLKYVSNAFVKVLFA